MAVLRTDVLARVLLDRLLSRGPMTEPAAMMLLEDRAPGRGAEAIMWARRAGMLRVVPANDGGVTMLEPVMPAHRPIAA